MPPADELPKFTIHLSGWLGYAVYRRNLPGLSGVGNSESLLSCDVFLGMSLNNGIVYVPSFRRGYPASAETGVSLVTPSLAASPMRMYVLYSPGTDSSYEPRTIFCLSSSSLSYGEIDNDHSFVCASSIGYLMQSLKSMFSRAVLISAAEEVSDF